MSDKSKRCVGLAKPATMALSAAVLAASAAPFVAAAVNPFAANPLANGYGQVNMQNAGDAAKAAEGLCGNHEGKPQQCEGKCGEGNADKTKDCKCKGAEDKNGAKKSATEKSAEEGRSGEGERDSN